MCVGVDVCLVEHVAFDDVECCGRCKVVGVCSVVWCLDEHGACVVVDEVDGVVVVVVECVVVVKCCGVVDESLVVYGYAFLVLDLRLEVAYRSGVRGGVRGGGEGVHVFDVNREWSECVVVDVVNVVVVVDVCPTCVGCCWRCSRRGRRGRHPNKKCLPTKTVCVILRIVCANTLTYNILSQAVAACEKMATER